MEIQLQELIDKIKTDGVAVAEQNASKKLADANAEADKIVADAKAEADRIVAQAKEESARFEKASEDAIRQAGRNILIEFRESITKELDTLVKTEVNKAYSKDMLGTLIPTVVEAWVKNTDAEDVGVLLNAKDLKALEQGLQAALKAKLNGGITLKSDDSFEGGFRIVEKDGTAYYDFSADAVADMFATYLNPRIAAILKEATNL
ncbi:V-type ATP synthase subunit E [Lachnospiraceae bacterium TWA4]|nr:V-type ATP synthase subunit E [Lachnospiraceae bacterium TWA4]